MDRIKTNVFYGYHPIVNFIYYLFVILITVFIMHPVILAIGFTAGFLYAFILNIRKTMKSLIFIVPMFLFITIINPLFSHKGITILFYIDNNPITMEAIIYGLASAVMLSSVILWFQSYNEIMSSDKFIYLFGKTIPSIALLISMALQLIPRFTKQINSVSKAQKVIGKDPSSGNAIRRAKNGMRVLSIVTTWALENSIETSQSMKARGYGSGKRSSYSLFRFQKRDTSLLILILLCTAGVISLKVLGFSQFLYYPYMRFSSFTAEFIALLLLHFCLCYTPIVLEIGDRIKWRLLRSKISALPIRYKKLNPVQNSGTETF